MRRLILTLCLGLIAAAAARADINPDNAFDFLRLGELSANIRFSTSDIDWIEDEAAAAERSALLDAALARDPEDLEAASELIALYEKGNRDAEAGETARRTLPGFRERFDHDRDEASALGFAKVALAAKAREEYGAAYRALQPFLESGRAGRETCVTAVELLMAANEYGLAKRIADHCIRISPPSAELYHLLYRVSIADTLQAKVFAVVQASAQEVLAEAGLDNFLAGLFEALKTEIDTPSLLRAIELEPGSYRYNFDAAIFEALTFCISKAALQFLAEDIENERLEDLLRRTGSAVLTPLREHLSQAEANRPKRDIQVFLVQVMAGICLAEFDKAELYALLAIGTRPDLPAGYDALILTTFSPCMMDDGYPSPEARRKATGIYTAKIKNAGESAPDYFGIAGLYFSEYGEADGTAAPPLLEKSRQYAEKALAVDPRFIPGRILLANLHIVSREYRRAITILGNIPEPEHPDLAGALLHNLGIARILAGERAAGTADLRRALELQPQNQDTRDALGELGPDPGGR